MPNQDNTLRPIHDDEIGRFSERLKSAMDGESVLSLATRSGLSEGSIRNLIKGGLPRLDNLIALADALGVSIEWLATGKQEPSQHIAAILGDQEAVQERSSHYRTWETALKEAKDQVEQSFASLGLHINAHWKDMMAAIVDKYRIAPQDVEDIASLIRSEADITSEFALIPGYQVQVSAGHGATPLDEKPTRYLAFRHKWLQFRNLNPKDQVLVFARGDSMEPTISDNNTLMIDTSQKEMIDGSIYVIRTDNHLVVKRVQKLINKGLLLLSDNKEYKEQLIEPTEANDLEVIGRVVWIGKDV